MMNYFQQNFEVVLISFCLRDREGLGASSSFFLGGAWSCKYQCVRLNGEASALCLSPSS
jgi:hypothetical protein